MAPASVAPRRSAARQAGDSSIHDRDPVGDRWPARRPGADLGQLLVDGPGDEAESDLPEGGQVRLGEEAVERDLGPLRRIDVAVAHPLAKRVRAHVDELDLVGLGQHRVGQPLVDRRPGDRRDGVGDRFEVLDVAGADDVDPGVADDLDVLPALLARRAGDVRVGQLVDDGHGRVAGDQGVGVHLLDDDAAVVDPPPRQDLEPVEQDGRLDPAVGLDEADHEVRPAVDPAVGLLEHLVRLADTGGHPEVDPQPAPAGPRGGAGVGPDAGEHLLAGGPDVERVRSGVVIADQSASRPSRSRLSRRTLTRGWPRKPRSAPSVWRATAARTSASDIPRAPATRATWYSAAAGLMSGSRPEAEVVTRSTGIGASPFAALQPVDLGADPVDQGLARRAEVRAGRGVRVVAVLAGGRRSAPEVLRRR